MKRYRILLIFWLLFLIGIWLFGAGNVGIYLTAATLICLSLEAFAAFRAYSGVSVGFSAQSTAAKNSDIPLKVTARNESRFAAAKVKVSLKCRNLFTGESETKTAWLSVGGRSKAEVIMTVGSARCGKFTATATEIAVIDAFGIFCMKKQTAETTSVLILPNIRPIKLSVGQHMAQDPDSAEYSMLSSGNDLGETFALREYRSGDRIRDIHWKLSEKTDSLTVREYGLPINNTVLILLDNIALNGFRSAEECENIGETAVSVSAALCETNFPHDIGWFDTEREAVSLMHIAGEDELNAALPLLLSAQTKTDSCSVLERFCEQCDFSSFSHIIVVTDGGSEEQSIGDTAVSFVEAASENGEGAYVEV